MAHIEKEIKFYFPSDQLGTLMDRCKGLTHTGSFFEETILYDHPSSERSFYRKEVDGRLRLRSGTSRGVGQNFGLLSFKQRLPQYKDDVVRKEKEVEFSFLYDELDSVKELLDDVFACPRISSYERNRHIFSDSHTEVTIDEFPFGIMLEIELKKSSDENLLEQVCHKLSLDTATASRLSCDDMYRKLCEDSGKQVKPFIQFADPDMPKI